jgi:hypothetical protein
MPAVKLIVFNAIVESPFLGVGCTGLLPALLFAAFCGAVSQGIQWSGSVEASVLDRYPAFTVHYRARFAELEGILNFGVFKIVSERLSILNW